jgi:spermidine synthase
MTRSRLLLVAFILSFCSFCYELVMAKTLVDLTGRAILWQSITIGVYIAALGLGSLWSSRIRYTRSALFSIELMLSVAGALSVILILVFHMIYRVISVDQLLTMMHASDVLEINPGLISSARYWPFVWFLVGAELMVFFIGFLSGFEIPLLLRIAEKREVGLNQLLGFHYLGVLLASLLFSFLFLPWLSLPLIAVLVASGNALVCVLFLSQNWVKVRKSRMLLMGLMMLIVAAGWLVSTPVNDWQKKIFYYYRPNLLFDPVKKKDFFQLMTQFPEVSQIRTLYQKIDLVWSHELWGGAQFTLYLDGHFQFSTLNEKFYHEGMAHVPIEVTRKVPKNVLVLGAGDGNLLRELVEYKDIQHITQVELDPVMVTLANQPLLTDINQHSMSDSRIELHLEDAFYYLRNNAQTFDAIYIDFPYPFTADIARLYSVEFFESLMTHLDADGFAVMDMPLYHQQLVDSKPELEQVNSVLFSTLDAAGLLVEPYEVMEETFVLLRKNDTPLTWKMHGPRSRYQGLNEDIFRDMRDYDYPHELDKEFVNSVFHPKLMNLDDSTF